MASSFRPPKVADDNTTQRVLQYGIRFPEGGTLWAEPGESEVSIPGGEPVQVDIPNHASWRAYVAKWTQLVKSLGASTVETPIPVQREVILVTTDALMVQVPAGKYDLDDLL